MEGTGARGGAHKPPSDVTGSPSHIGGMGGGARYNEPYPEEGGENKIMGALVKRKAIPGSLIDKLLNNPHAALRRNHRDADYRRRPDTSNESTRVSSR